MITRTRWIGNIDNEHENFAINTTRVRRFIVVTNSIYAECGTGVRQPKPLGRLNI